MRARTPDRRLTASLASRYFGIYEESALPQVLDVFRGRCWLVARRCTKHWERERERERKRKRESVIKEYRHLGRNLLKLALRFAFSTSFFFFYSPISTLSTGLQFLSQWNGVSFATYGLFRCAREKVVRRLGWFLRVNSSMVSIFVEKERKKERLLPHINSQIQRGS